MEGVDCPIDTTDVLWLDISCFRKNLFYAQSIGMRPNDSGTDPNPWVPGYWDGKLDDVRLNDRVLSPLEIFDLYSEGGTDRDEEGLLPSIPFEFALRKNYPNPFKPQTDIQYKIPWDSHVTLKIYNITGQEIISPVDADRKAGYYTTSWDGHDIRGAEASADIYFCTMRVGSFSQAIKMVLIR